MAEKCFCHLNGYKVKDADARAAIEEQRVELEKQHSELVNQATAIENQATKIEAQRVELVNQATEIESQRLEIENQAAVIEAQRLEIEALQTKPALYEVYTKGYLKLPDNTKEVLTLSFYTTKKDIKVHSGAEIISYLCANGYMGDGYGYSGTFKPVSGLLADIPILFIYCDFTNLYVKGCYEGQTIIRYGSIYNVTDYRVKEVF